MSNWIISYSRDNNTSTLKMESDQQPSIEQAVRYVLDWARSHLEKGEFGDSQDRNHTDDEPAVILLRDYGVTISGISAC